MSRLKLAIAARAHEATNFHHWFLGSGPLGDGDPRNFFLLRTHLEAFQLLFQALLVPSETFLDLFRAQASVAFLPYFGALLNTTPSVRAPLSRFEIKLI